MEINVGKTDKTLRIIAGVALLAWALAGGPVWAWIGLLPLVTGIFGVCPAYSIFGINTCSTK
ncbi:MAG: YgaP family membrane protein [Methylophilus sp.]|jgi:hypothetical protein